MMRAFDLDRITSDDVDVGLENCKWADNSREVIETTIGVIHALPRLHRYEISRETLEVYLGRSSPSNVLNRLRRHRDEKRHGFGAILFQGLPDRVARLEEIGNFLLTRIKRNGCLCIASANIRTGGGPLASEDTSLIYLTWGSMREREIGNANMDAIRDIVSGAEEQFANRDTRGLEESLLALRRPMSHFERICWAAGHRPWA
jgi:hypothetical protein